MPSRGLWLGCLVAMGIMTARDGQGTSSIAGCSREQHNLIGAYRSGTNGTCHRTRAVSVDGSDGVSKDLGAQEESCADI